MVMLMLMFLLLQVGFGGIFCEKGLGYSSKVYRCNSLDPLTPPCTWFMIDRRNGTFSAYGLGLFAKWLVLTEAGVGGIPKDSMRKAVT